MSNWYLLNLILTFPNKLPVADAANGPTRSPLEKKYIHHEFKINLIEDID